MTSSAVALPRVKEPVRSDRALGHARAAFYVAAATAVALAVLEFFATNSSDEHFPYTTADYLLTANGVPFMLAPLVALQSLRSLFGGREGRLGGAGVTVMSAALVGFQPVFIYSLAAGREESIGPAYVLLALASIVGLALFVAGSWRARLMSRWLLALWLFAWIIAGALPIGPGGAPLLLAVAYLAIAADLGRRYGSAR